MVSYYSRQAEMRRNDEAIQVGYDYMEGKISIAAVEKYLNEGTSLGRSEKVKLVAQGARAAEAQGKAIKSRVQPEQEAELFKQIHPRRNAKQQAMKYGKLADRPEHTKYKPSPKPAPKPKSTGASGPRPNARNAYDVKAQRKKDLKILLDKHTRGEAGVKEVKRESKAAAGHSAYKNVVFNETHHRYVGPNRLGKTEKPWDYQPKRRKKKA